MSDLRTPFPGQARPEVIGRPKVKRLTAPISCPHCRCELMEVRVRVKLATLKGGKGHGVYLGCPACPYASPMAASADASEDTVVKRGGK